MFPPSFMFVSWPLGFSLYLIYGMISYASFWLCYSIACFSSANLSSTFPLLSSPLLSSPPLHSALKVTAYRVTFSVSPQGSLTHTHTHTRVPQRRSVHCDDWDNKNMEAPEAMARGAATRWCHLTLANGRVLSHSTNMAVGEVPDCVFVSNGFYLIAIQLHAGEGTDIW